MVKTYLPKNLNEALEIINNENCTIFSGGTDLMVRKKQWTGIVPNFEKNVVIISDLQEIKNISMDSQYLNIGGACTCAQIMKSGIVPDYMKDVFSSMASPAIRNIATVAGNICNSSPAGDSIPLFYALESILVLKSINGERMVPINEFITAPGRNIKNNNEILTQIKIPIKNYNIKYYKKVGTRKSIALSKLSFIGLAVKNNNKLEDVRIAFGSVSPVIIKDKKLEQSIINMFNKNDIKNDEIVNSYAKCINPIDDQRSTAKYRKNVSLRLLKDFLSKLSI